MSEPEFNQDNIETLTDTVIDGMDMEDVTVAAKAWLIHSYSNDPLLFRDDWKEIVESA